MSRDRLRNVQQGGRSAQQFEMSHVNPEYTAGEQTGMLDDTFYLNEISEIQDEIDKLNANVDAMSRLHAQQIDAVELSGSNGSQQLESLTEETRALSFAVKRQIQALNSRPVDARAARSRGPHIERVRSRFMESIRSFQAEEKAYRDRTKDRMARQYMIVNPDASPEEVQAVVESGQNIQIFAQATAGARYGQAQSAYNAVRDRHAEIRRIEATLAELGQLFQDISLLVEQQGDTINSVEEKAREAEVDIEKGKVYTITARLKALSYRQKRWICLSLSLIIIVIIAVVVACEVSDKC